MATASAVSKVQVSVKLNNGTSSGKVKTVSVSLGALDTTGAMANGADDKIMAVVTLLGEVLSKAVYSVDKIVTNSLTVA